MALFNACDCVLQANATLPTQLSAANAAAVIFAHNHPSGVSDPSQSDKRITERLKSALSLVDVRVLDHFIVGDTEVFSFAEHGLI